MLEKVVLKNKSEILVELPDNISETYKQEILGVVLVSYSRYRILSKILEDVDRSLLSLPYSVNSIESDRIIILGNIIILYLIFLQFEMLFVWIW